LPQIWWKLREGLPCRLVGGADSPDLCPGWGGGTQADCPAGAADQRRQALVLSGDLRGTTGGQAFATNAPVTLLFVADLSRLSKAQPQSRPFYAGVDTGYISQNVYLYCASEGLATVVHDLDRAPLQKVLKLRPDQRIILAQAVGYPKD